MKVVAEISEKGVLEQRFDLETDGDVVPGILWRPAAAFEPPATILIGHGGTHEAFFARHFGRKD